MRPQGPTFFLLGGSTKNWRTATADKISVGDETLTLTGLQDGPDSLISKDGSLGRVVLPIGMATDDQGTLYLLGQRAPGVKRFDPDTCSFVRLEGIGDSFGSNIAIAGHNLYLADLRNRRVQVFALGTRAIRHVWGPRDDKCRRTSPTSKRAWEPVDVASHQGRAYILDRRYSRVCVHRPGTDRLKLVVKGATAGVCWTRIALDKQGRIYLLDMAQEKPRVEVYDQHGRHLETKTSSAEIRERFTPPAVQLNEEEKNEWSFTLPENLRLHCEKCSAEKARLAFRVPCDPPSTQPVPEPPPIPKVLRFDREGRPWTKTRKLTGPKTFEAEGKWLSEALDSEIYNCQWHRIELEISKLPAGTRVEVYTYSSSKTANPAEIELLMDHFGLLAYSVAGQAEPPKSKSTTPNGHEFLVQSREGQFVWMRIKLSGDGYDTPAIRSVRIHYPRSSYLEYLPALFSADDDSRWFLERFLSIFQTEWDQLEKHIDDVAAHFDPKAVPGGKALEFLASWFALPLEGTWDDAKKRQLLQAVSEIYFGSWKASTDRTDRTVCLTEANPEKLTRRGTREGVRRYLQVYLQNITGLDATQQGAFPHIDEGFRERQRLMLALGNTSALSHCAPLWSPSVVGRLQFGSYAREGEARLVSTGDPEREIFEEFSHRFRVFVPSSWINTADEEEMVHRALRAEKPAHTSYELCLVEPRFRVGLQSTVGVDTILGAWPKAHLTCMHDKDIPPSRQPRHRLGLDTILAPRPGDHPTLQVGPKTRTGLDTLLN